MQRRHDIDALRALAFGLLILYHVGMAYVAGWHWHLKSEYTAEWLRWPMMTMNLWRMDLVFLVSGIAFAWLAGKDGASRSIPRLIAQRSLRLLLPLVFGMYVVVPYQAYAQATANGSVAPGFGDFLLRYVQAGPWPTHAFDGSDFGITWNHLWFLPYLWIYTIALCLLLPVLRSATGARLAEVVRAQRGSLLLLAPVLPICVYSFALWSRFPARHDLIHDAWLHAVYGTLFLYGWLIGLDTGLWTEFKRLRRRSLLLAIGAFACFGILRELAARTDAAELRLAARMLADLYMWLILCAILGWSHHLLNYPWPWLAWARESVYPWYMLHQTLIIAALVLLMPLRLGGWLEAPLVALLTVVGCWLLTDGLVRRVGWLRVLFGLPRMSVSASPSDAMIQHIKDVKLDHHAHHHRTRP